MRWRAAGASPKVAEREVGFEEGAVEAFFGVVGGEAAGAAGGGEDGALGESARGGVGGRAGLPELEHGAEVGGVGGGGAGEEAGELEAFALRPEEQHGEDGDDAPRQVMPMRTAAKCQSRRWGRVSRTMVGVRKKQYQP